MSKTTIKIDRLEIRLKGLSPETVGSAREGLEDALRQGLTEGHFQPREQDARALGRINAGTVPVPNGIGGTELRRVIANRITRTLQSHLSDNQTGRKR
jgi:hypothetical protein